MLLPHGYDRSLSCGQAVAVMRLPPPMASDGLTRLQRSRVCHRPGPVGVVGLFPANRQPLSGAISASGSSMTRSFLFSGNPQQELTNIQAKLGPFLQSWLESSHQGPLTAKQEERYIHPIQAGHSDSEPEPWLPGGCGQGQDSGQAHCLCFR